MTGPFRVKGESVRKNPVRDALLAEVKSRRTAAGKKVSRLERNGIRVRKEGLDPRLSNTALENMNSRQLRSHLNTLNRFTSRENSYVAGLHGIPLSGAMWRQYKQLETIHNRNSIAHINKVGGYQIPGLGVTVAERRQQLAQSKFGGGDFHTFQTLERTPGNITGDKGVQELIQGMRKKVSPLYLRNEAKRTRETLRKMFERTGNQEAQDVIDQLTNEQLITLVDDTPFMKAVESSYAMAKSTSTDRPSWHSEVYEDNEEQIREWSEWAKQNFNDQSMTEQKNDDDTPVRNGTSRSRRVSFRAGVGEFNPRIEEELPPQRTRGLKPPSNGTESVQFKPGKGKYNPKLL